MPILALEKLDINGFTLEEEWMTALKMSLESYDDALNFLNRFKSFFKYPLFRSPFAKSPIFRLKIETPYHSELNPEDYLYLETHSPAEFDNGPFEGGYSRDLFSGKILQTERCYDSELFHDFASRNSNRKLELCLLDTYVGKDADWIHVPLNLRKRGIGVTKSFYEKYKTTLKTIL